MPILEGTELADLQAEIYAVMQETSADLLDVERGQNRERDTDNPDEYTVGPTTVVSNVPCNYSETQPQHQRLVANRVKDPAKLLTFEIPANIDIKDSDYINVHAKGNAPAFRANVIAVLKASNAVKWNLIAATL